MKTRTGGYPIGSRAFYPNWSPAIDEVIGWAIVNELECLDVGANAETAKQVSRAGLRIGSVDLPGWATDRDMITGDEVTRKKALGNCQKLIMECADIGPVNYFVVMLPQQPLLQPKENFGYMLKFLQQIVPTLEECRATFSIEGWPGPGALCCTPESLRALFKAIPSRYLAINYDPSHLIRVGICPYRFLEEFGDKVCHVHGKDTEFMTERLYNLGNYQPALETEDLHFGGTSWRYTIPGHGCFNWLRGLRILNDKGYHGCISIELEDGNFCISAEGDRTGVLQGANLLKGC